MSKSKITPKKVSNPKDEEEAWTKTIEQIILLLENMVEDKKILVIGGKSFNPHQGVTNLSTEFINSLSMALKQESTEILTPSVKDNDVREAVIYQRPATNMKQPLKVTFYDTSAFSTIHDQEKLATLIRFLLEGKLKPSEFRPNLFKSEAELRKHYKNIEVKSSKIFKAVIYLEDDSNDGDAIILADLITKAIKRSDKRLVNTIPVIRVLLNGEKDPITADHKVSVSADESNLTKKHNFGLPQQRYNLETYRWSDAYTDFDMDTETCPPGYKQLQQQILDTCEKIKNAGQQENADQQKRELRGSPSLASPPTKLGKCSLGNATGFTRQKISDLNDIKEVFEDEETQDSGVTIDLDDELTDNDHDNETKTNENPTRQKNSDNTELCMNNTNLTNALIDSPIPSIANLQAAAPNSGRNSPHANIQAVALTQFSASPAGTPDGSSTPKQRSTSRSSGRRMSSPEIQPIGSFSRQNSAPTESSFYKESWEDTDTDNIFVNNTCNSYNNNYGFTPLRAQAVSSNFAKSSSMSNLQNLANKLNADISQRFKFNYRIPPAKSKIKSLSLLLFLEQLLEIIFYENSSGSVLGSIWQLNMRARGTSSSGEGGVARDQPLTDLFKTLMGKRIVGSKREAKRRN